MSDDVKKMLGAGQALELLVAELRASGVDDLAIAAALMDRAGVIWRDQLPDERERRRVALHAAEVAITGLPQPFDAGGRP